MIMKMKRILMSLCFFGWGWLACADETLELNTSHGVGKLSFAAQDKGFGVTGFSFCGTRFAVAEEPASLWRLVFRAGLKGEEKTLEASSFKGGQWARTEDGAKIVWKNIDLDASDAAVDVTCEVTVNAAEGRYEFRIGVCNRSAKYGLFTVDYPRFGQVITKGSGTVITPGNNWGGIRLESAWKMRRAYPDYHAPVQLICFEQPKAGIMLAALDPQATVKHLNLDDKFNFHFEFAGIDAGKPGAAGAPTFPVALYPYDGDWWKAAKKYRAWAVRHASWMKAGTLVARRDTAVNRFRDIGFWMLVSSKNEIAEAEKSLDLAYARINGRVPLATHFYCWHKHPFDTLYPDYFPAKDGFKEMVGRQVQKGVVISPYINGRIWDRASEEFASIAQNVCIDATGEQSQETWNKRQFSAVCPWTQLWFDKMVATGERLVNEYGVNSLYYDQMASMVALNCYSDQHGHPVGGGCHWTDGYRKILKEIRKRYPAIPITTENFSEPYVDVIDGFLMWSPLSDNDIPLIPAIYSGYCQTFGCRTSPSYTIEAFRAAQGRSFLWGCQPGWEREWILEGKFAPRFEYLIRLAELHLKEREFFCDGELVGEVTNLAETPILALKWQRWGKPINANIPAVQAVRWRSLAGKELVAICNYAETGQRFDGGAGVGMHELAAGEVKLVHLNP